MSIMSRFSTVCVGLIFFVGCTERDAPPQLDHDLPDPQPIMPTAPPKYNPLVLADQANYKPLAPRELSEKDHEELRKVMGIKEKPKPEPEAEGGDSKGSVKDIAKAGLAGLKNLLGGKSDAKAGESGDAAAAAVEAAKALRSEARPEVKETPPNPGGRSDQGIVMARRLAAEDATKKMISIAVKFPISQGGQTIGDVIGTKQGVNDTKLKNLRPVAFKWIDADTLEVEVEISIADLADSFKEQIPDANLDPVKQALEGKYLAATGRGVIPMNLRSHERSLPGRRAAQASEGI